MLSLRTVGMLAMFAAGPLGLAGAQTLEITLIPVPAGHEAVFLGGLNNLGQVVGTAQGPFDEQLGLTGSGFVWSRAAGMTLLPQSGTGTFSGASGINDAGVIVGNGFTMAPPAPGLGIPFSPLRWSGGAPQVLPITGNPAGVNAGARAVNASGVMAGSVPGSATGPGSDTYTRAARWSSDGLTVTPLEEPGEGLTLVNAMNDAGVVVGSAPYPGGTSSFGNLRPYRWDGTAATPLPRLGMDRHGSANDINAAGVIVGTSGEFDLSTLFDVVGLGLAWPAGGGAPIPLLPLAPGHNSSANSINDSGRIAGYDLLVDPETLESTFRAIMWPSAGAAPVDLNTMIDPGSPGWVLEQVHVINNTGEMIGTGTFQGVPAAFFARVVPAPAGAPALGAGAALLLAARRRRRGS